MGVSAFDSIELFGCGDVVAETGRRFGLIGSRLEWRDGAWLPMEGSTAVVATRCGNRKEGGRK